MNLKLRGLTKAVRLTLECLSPCPIIVPLKCQTVKVGQVFFQFNVNAMSFHARFLLNMFRYQTELFVLFESDHYWDERKLMAA